MACSTAPFPAAAPFLPSPCHRRVQQLSPSAQPFQASRVVMVRWTPSPRGWFKLNFDGSVYHDGSGRASIGGAIRDSAGRVVLAFAEKTEHSTVGIVEARALIRGLQLMRGLRLERVVAEGDDLVLVQLLRGEETQTRIPVAMQEETFAGRDVRHVYREGNQVTHTLCRQAYHSPGVWMGGLVSPAVFEKAEDDRHGVAHERAVVRAAWRLPLRDMAQNPSSDQPGEHDVWLRNEREEGEPGMAARLAGARTCALSRGGGASASARRRPTANKPGQERASRRERRRAGMHRRPELER
ncbi:hypothetical protein ACP70R_039603 [Stipagrostis hirtigluma subsp. patula]